MAFKAIFYEFGLILLAAVAAPSYRSETDIEIDTGLHFVEEPSDVIVSRNQATSLHCSAIGTDGAQARITWRKDGLELSPDHRRSILDNGTLVIHKVLRRHNNQKDDSGIYECVAENNVGIIFSRQAILQVAELSSFSGQPQDVTATQGGTVSFQCGIEGTPKPRVTWERNQQLLPQSDRYIHLLPSHNLQLYNITLSDSGQYRCRAVNVVKTRFSNEASLSVLPGRNTDLPRMLIQPRDQEVVVGEKIVIMECAITPSSVGGLPLIEWVRKDNQSLPQGRTRIVGMGNLEIRDVQWSDSGVYRCFMPTLPTVSAEALLTVLVPPHLVADVTNVIAIKPQVVRLKCEFNGTPKPEITWMKNGSNVQHNGRIKLKDGELFIEHITDSDSGLYQCWAQNSVGREGRVIRLFVQPSENAPDAPTGLWAYTVSSRTVELVWSESLPKNGRPTMAYSVHYNSLGGAELQKVVQDPRITIEQLQPNTNYSFYVVAYNDKSASQHSKTVTLLTEEDVPVSAPDIRLSSNGLNSLKVQWDEMLPEKLRGIVTRYQIRYRKHGVPKSEVTLNFSAGPTEYVVTDLEEQQKYDVRMLAGTRIGFPVLDENQWPWTSQIVGSSSNTVTLHGIEFRVLNETAISMVWDRPESPGEAELLGFKINYNIQESSEEPKMIILVEDVTRAVLEKLQPDTMYNICICAFTDLTDGDNVCRSLKTWPSRSTDSAIPTAVTPVEIQVKPLNETSIRVRWFESSADSSQVVRYTVQYWLRNNRESVREVSVNGSTREVVVGGLQPFTTYQFAVHTHIRNANNTNGLVSTETECQTHEGLPGSPELVSSYLIGPTDVQVNWKPPMSPNGVILLYSIYFTDDAKKVETDWNIHMENGSAYQSLLIGLRGETLYYVKLQAATKKGGGSLSPAITVYTKAEYPSTTSAGEEILSAKTQGIMIGLGISLGCALICLVTFLVACRYCRKGRSREAPTYLVNGHADKCMNGVRECNGVLATSNISQESDKVSSHCERCGQYTAPKLNGYQKSNGYSMPNGYSTQIGCLDPKQNDYLVTDHLLKDKFNCRELCQMTRSQNPNVRRASDGTDDTNPPNATSVL